MNLKEAWAREEIVAELETIECLLKESPPKVLNAGYQLGQLVKKSGLEKPLEEIRTLLRHNPPKVLNAGYRLHLLIRKLAGREVVHCQ